MLESKQVQTAVTRVLEKRDTRACWQNDCTLQAGLGKAPWERNGLTSKSW